MPWASEVVSPEDRLNAWTSIHHRSFRLRISAGDPKRDYLADGITDSLISDPRATRWPGVPIVSP